MRAKQPIRDELSLVNPQERHKQPIAACLLVPRL